MPTRQKTIIQCCPPPLYWEGWIFALWHYKISGQYYCMKQPQKNPGIHQAVTALGWKGLTANVRWATPVGWVCKGTQRGYGASDDIHRCQHFQQQSAFALSEDNFLQDIWAHRTHHPPITKPQLVQRSLCQGFFHGGPWYRTVKAHYHHPSGKSHQPSPARGQRHCQRAISPDSESTHQVLQR